MGFFGKLLRSVHDIWTGGNRPTASATKPKTSVKPAVEQLETRELPALLGGGFLPAALPGPFVSQAIILPVPVMSPFPAIREVLGLRIDARGDYTYTHTIGSVFQGDTPQKAMSLLQSDPARFFPFPISNKPIREGELYRLEPIPSLGGYLRAVQVTPTSFTLKVESSDYIVTGGSTITFSTAIDAQGNVVLRKHTHLNGSDAVERFLDQIGPAGAWAKQAANLRAALHPKRTETTLSEHGFWAGQHRHPFDDALRNRNAKLDTKHQIVVPKEALDWSEAQWDKWLKKNSIKVPQPLDGADRAAKMHDLRMHVLHVHYRDQSGRPLGWNSADVRVIRVHRQLIEDLQRVQREGNLPKAAKEWAARAEVGMSLVVNVLTWQLLSRPIEVDPGSRIPLRIPSPVAPPVTHQPVKLVSQPLPQKDAGTLAAGTLNAATTLPGTAAVITRPPVSTVPVQVNTSVRAVIPGGQW